MICRTIPSQILIVLFVFLCGLSCFACGSDTVSPNDSENSATNGGSRGGEVVKMVTLPMSPSDSCLAARFYDPYLIIESLSAHFLFNTFTNTQIQKSNFFAQAPSGECLFSGMDKKQRISLNVYKKLNDKSPARTIECSIGGDQVPVYSGGFIGEHVIVFPQVDLGHNKYQRPLIQNGSSLEEHMAFPQCKSDGLPYCGVQTLQNGNVLVIWNDRGYEFKPNSIKKPVGVWMLNSQSSFVGWTSVLTGKDGIFYTSGRKLYEMHRGDKEAHAHIQSIDNILTINPGPENSVLLKLGDNPYGDIGILYFPSGKSFIHIKPTIFDNLEMQDQGIYWSEKSRKFFVLSFNKLYALSEKNILQLPRQH